ncbi:MAG: DUF4065 domain-containing protein [Alphaproteobacteria bacterium]|nr:DUF4065 domain-containing protein [Alphaproteobacteria bacterium]
MHDSISVADMFLELAKPGKGTLTPIQLLKLVYIAHGWMLGLYGRPLIRDEIQAWQYGPAIPHLYNAIRSFKSNPVQGPLSAIGGDELDAEENGIVTQVYEIYGQMSGPALSRITHQPGSPWAEIYVPGEFGSVIPNDIILDHYSQLAEENR